MAQRKMIVTMWSGLVEDECDQVNAGQRKMSVTTVSERGSVEDSD